MTYTFRSPAVAETGFRTTIFGIRSCDT